MWVLGGSRLLLKAEVKPFVLKLLKQHYIKINLTSIDLESVFYNKYTINSGHIKIKIVLTYHVFEYVGIAPFIIFPT